MTLRSRARRLRSPRAIALVAGGALALSVGVAVAAAGELPSQASANWAGYVALSPGGAHAKRFTAVSGSWVQPVATCTPGKAAFAAFWVGLGGYAASSRALEQDGSEADCSSTGQVFYYAWYEFVPAPPVTVAIRVAPGDRMYAKVAVSGHQIVVTLRDLTTGARFVKHAVMRSPTPDTSAAEWIAEAPSNCDQANKCTPLSLTNFGSVSFTDAKAFAVDVFGRHSGPINDRAWTFGAINLTATQRSTLDRTAGSPTAAIPGLLSGGGRGFTVTVAPLGPTGPSGPTGTSGASGATGTTGSSGGH